MAAQKLISFFNEIDKTDLPSVGGKGANLGEMTKAGFPVPDGFCVTVEAYDKFIEENNLFEFLSETLNETDVHDPKGLDTATKKIQSKVLKGRVPKDVEQEIFKAYKKLSGKLGHTLVAVRSSATAEDLPDASFAGQQATYLNVKGEANLVEAVRKCWASLFTGRAIFYREENKIEHDQVKISVIVQQMVQSDVSGVMFTVDPVTNDKDKIVIEAVWGLGELIVQGSVVPDRYTVQKDTYSILSKEISDQSIQLVRSGKDSEEKEVPKSIRDKPKLKDEHITELAKIGDRLQKHYYFPQDVEWAKEKDELYIVQTRPVTTIKEADKDGKPSVDKEGFKIADKPILKGTGASPGYGTGHVRIVKDPKDIGKVKEGDVLVSTMTSPDFVPAMKRASAIVTDQGGQTSHAAIVSRELGIPCIVGSKEATTKLKEETVVTVDGSKGFVYLGSKIATEGKKEEAKKKEKIITEKSATTLYVNLAEPERVEEIAKLNVDGVGLLRAEFMIANIGVHPKEAIKKKEQGKFVDSLTKDIEKFCKPFGERPVVYRATDFKTNEYRQLPGGKHWEPEEPNPMLGYRGAFRYVADPEVFTLELRAIKKVREKHKNLWMMIPYVRSPEELARVRRIVAAEGLFEEPSFKFWMMVELPVNVISLKEFIRVGIDGVSIGSNDLTMLIQGTDRDNAEVAEAYDERSPAVRWALKRVVKICHKEGISSSICGQAASDYEDLVEDLVKEGITSISVNPDAINRMRGVLIEAEKKFIKGK